MESRVTLDSRAAERELTQEGSQQSTKPPTMRPYISRPRQRPRSWQTPSPSSVVGSYLWSTSCCDNGARHEANPTRCPASLSLSCLGCDKLLFARVALLFARVARDMLVKREEALVLARASFILISTFPATTRVEERFCVRNPAVTYSPRASPPKYHRR